jgi:hypothetical protein
MLAGRRSAWDLFFDARPAATLATDAVGWPIREIVLKFVASPPNGLVMQAGDFGDLFDPAMPQPHGFTTGDPSPLLFVESIHQSIELSMLISAGMFQALSTCSTTTLMPLLACHCSPTFP